MAPQTALEWAMVFFFTCGTVFFTAATVIGIRLYRSSVKAPNGRHIKDDLYDDDDIDPAEDYMTGEDRRQLREMIEADSRARITNENQLLIPKDSLKLDVPAPVKLESNNLPIPGPDDTDFFILTDEETEYQPDKEPIAAQLRREYELRKVGSPDANA